MIKKSNLTQFFVSTFMIMACALGISTAQAGTKTTYNLAAGSHSDSVSHQYNVYTPSSYDGITELPMVFVLHGCHQTNDTVFDEFGWQDTAETHNFILVAPHSNADATSQYGNLGCWRYWTPQHQDRGEGANLDLIHIGQKVENDYTVDADRRYVTGLSSGGFMTTIAAATYNDYWTAAVPMAGGGYLETTSSYNGSSCASDFSSSRTAQQNVDALQTAHTASGSSYLTPIMFMNSKNDCTVSIHNGENATAGFALFYNATLDSSKTMDCSITDAKGTIACENEKYTDSSGNILVESYFYEGPSDRSSRGNYYPTDSSKGHYFSGGKGNGQWSKTWGQNAREATWAFFARYNRSGITPPPPPTGTACPSVTATLTEHVAASRAYTTGSNNFCESHTDSTYNLVQGGKAEVCNYWYACAQGDGVQLGLNNTYTQATVYESPIGIYTTTQCNASSGTEYLATGTAELLGNNGSNHVKLFETQASSGSYTQTDPANCSNDAPVVTLNGDATLTVNLNDTFTDPGATANDTEDGMLTVSVEGLVDTSIVNEYTLTYRATDSQALSGSAVRSVNVVNPNSNEAPVITLLGNNPMTMTQGDTFSDPGANVNDDHDANLLTTVTGSVDINTVGSYTLEYNTQDSHGNAAITVTRTVNVEAASNVCITDTVGNHLAAGRVFTYGGYNCKTSGGNDQVHTYTFTCAYLEVYGGNPSYSIEETSENVFNKVNSCQ